jgi:hypothetical protein
MRTYNVVAIGDRVAECMRFVVDSASNGDTDFALFHQTLLYGNLT